MSLPPLPQALIFDWDNTLVDTWPSIIQAMNTTLVAMGHQPWSESEAKGRIAKSMRDAFPALFGDRWLEAKDIFQSSFAAIHLDMLATLPGAEQLLKTARRLGLHVAVVSNKSGGFLRAESTRLGWDQYFVHLVGAGDASRDKPAREPVEMALAGSPVKDMAQVWFIGDNQVDIECGQNAGCRTVLLHPDPESHKNFGAYSPHHVFCGCADFTVFLETLAVPSGTVQ